MKTVHPNYISGLTQADGSFYLVVAIRKPKGVNWRPYFTITATLSNVDVLYVIKDYFNCGYVCINKRKNAAAEYIVGNTIDLYNIIIPHFDKYSVLGIKGKTYLKFKKFITIMVQKKHLEKKGKINLLALGFSMNEYSQRNLSRKNKIYSLLNLSTKDISSISSPNLLNYEKNLSKKTETDSNIKLNRLITPEYIAGLIEGDGSFSVPFYTDGSIKPIFDITVNKNDQNFLICIQDLLGGVGSIQKVSDKIIRLQVTSLKEIFNKIIPYLDKVTFHTQRGQRYLIWRKVVFLLQNPLNKNIRLQIIELAYEMYKGGFKREYSKSKYIKWMKEKSLF